jgi:DNA-binding transcriptional ArsR family regulator
MITSDQTHELADMFRLMGDHSRLRIVLACLEGPTAVGDIAGRLGLSPSLVSHHLRLLRAARIVRAARDGKHVYYSAADAHISDVLRDMIDHLVEPQTGEG